MDTSNEEAFTVIVKSLSFDASEDDLTEFFKGCGEIVSVRVPVFEVSGRKKGSGFVQFSSEDGLNKALLKNEGEILGRPVRISKDRRFEKRVKPEGCLTIFVGNVSLETTEDQLRGMFESCGAVTSVRRRKGFAHVAFTELDAVDKAVAMTGTDLAGQPVHVDFADRPIRARNEGRRRTKAPKENGEQGPETEDSKGKRKPRARRKERAPREVAEPVEDTSGKLRVFVGNVSEDTTEDSLRAVLEACGAITSVRVASGKRAGFAHVEFVEEASVAKAVELTGTEVGGQPIRVEVAKPKAKPAARARRRPRKDKVEE